MWLRLFWWKCTIVLILPATLQLKISKHITNLMPRNTQKVNRYFYRYLIDKRSKTLSCLENSNGFRVLACWEWSLYIHIPVVPSGGNLNIARWTVHLNGLHVVGGGYISTPTVHIRSWICCNKLLCFFLTCVSDHCRIITSSYKWSMLFWILEGTKNERKLCICTISEF